MPIYTYFVILTIAAPYSCVQALRHFYVLATEKRQSKENGPGKQSKQQSDTSDKVSIHSLLMREACIKHPMK